MISSGDMYVILLVEKLFQTFTKKEIADTAKTTEVLLRLLADSREAVDEVVNKAVAAGGTTPTDPQAHEFMYGHGFQDLDGLWEVMYRL